MTTRPWLMPCFAMIIIGLLVLLVLEETVLGRVFGALLLVGGVVTATGAEARTRRRP